MPAQHPFNYVIVRVVPSVERGEYVNAGVILFCRTLGYLAARVELNRERLLALDPDCQVDAIRQHLELIPRICSGGGPIGKLSLSERFHWLASPRSTVVQVSDIHAGLCEDPADTLNRMFEMLVL